MEHLRFIVAVYCVYHIVVVLIDATYSTSEGRCQFTEDLYGRWYQKDYGDLIINGSVMKGKGNCVDKLGEHYLLYNRKMLCYQCLEMYQRGHNIIQYRESYCGDTRDLNITCAMITTRDVMHTMLRVNFVPQQCPFSDAYHYSYNNNSGGFCQDPMSYAKSCAGSSDFRFHFGHCTDISYSYEQQWDLTCLGSWMDDERTYLYGKFKAPHLTKRHLMYRCMLYQKVGTVVYLSMSGDSTCMGVLSSRDGPVVIELTKDIYGWPKPACHFPIWLSRYTWRDLSGRHLYSINDHNNQIDIRFHSEDNGWHVSHTLRCLRILTHNSTAKSFYAVSFTSHRCEQPVYQCIKFVKKKDGIIEYHQGGTVEYDTDPCFHNTHFRNPKSHLLMPTPTVNTACPLAGFHNMLDDPTLCNGGSVQSRCDVIWAMDIITHCSPIPRLRLECLHTWGGRKKTYLIASKLGDRNGVANCFVIKRKGLSLQFGIDKTCNFGTTDIIPQTEKYNLDPVPDLCPVKPTFPPEPPVVDSEPIESRHNNIERSATSARKENAAPHSVDNSQPALPLAKSGANSLLYVNHFRHTLVYSQMYINNSIYIVYSLIMYIAVHIGFNVNVHR